MTGDDSYGPAQGSIYDDPRIKALLAQQGGAGAPGAPTPGIPGPGGPMAAPPMGAGPMGGSPIGGGMPPGGAPPQGGGFAPNPQPSAGIGHPAYNPNANGGIPPDVVKLMLQQGGNTAEKAQIARQQKMADMMRGSAQQLNDPRGQMVSGHYVGPNIGTAAIGALNGYLANKKEAGADEMSKALDKKREDAMSGWFNQFNGGGSE